MKIVKEAVYASIFGAGVCLAGCGRNDNQNEGNASSVEDSITKENAIHTEMDSLVSPDTIMPAP